MMLPKKNSLVGGNNVGGGTGTGQMFGGSMSS